MPRVFSAEFRLQDSESTSAIFSNYAVWYREGRKKQNLKCVRYNVDGECRVILVANRDIPKGERLYYDYNGYEHEYPTEHFVWAFFFDDLLIYVTDAIDIPNRLTEHMLLSCPSAWNFVCHNQLKRGRNKVIHFDGRFQQPWGFSSKVHSVTLTICNWLFLTLQKFVTSVQRVGTRTSLSRVVHL